MFKAPVHPNRLKAYFSPEDRPTNALPEVENDPDLVDEETSISDDDASEDTPATGSSSRRHNHSSADNAQRPGPTSLGPGTDNTLTPTDPDSEGEEELYEVQKLTGCKTMWGEKHYRVKWKDYNINEATWEPASALPPEIIQEYHIEHTSLGRQRKRKGQKR